MKKNILFLILLFLILFFSCADRKTFLNKNSPLSHIGDNYMKQEENPMLQNKNQKETSYIFVQHNTDGTDNGFDKLISKMEKQGISFYKNTNNPDGIVAPDDVVLLKINCQWAERGGTNADLINSVVKAITAHPAGFTGEIIIADNGQGQYGSSGNGGSLDWEKTNSKDKTTSAIDVVNKFKKEIHISGFLWDTITMNRVKEFSDGDKKNGFVIEEGIKSTGFEISYPKFTTEYGTMVSLKNGIWNDKSKTYDTNKLKIINMPVLKYHFIYHVTGAVKSYMGVVANRLTEHRPHRNVGNGAMGTEMAKTRVPTLNIMDMIWVGADKGPGTTYSTAVAKNMIASSIDPIALDFWASKYVLMPEIEKLPGGRAAFVNPENKEPGTFGYWLKLSMEELKKSGFQVTMNESSIHVIDQ